MALKINFLSETPNPFDTYGRTEYEINTSAIKVLTDIQNGKGTSQLTDEDKENLIIMICHGSQHEAQVISMLLLGEEKTIELVKKLKITYMVDALLPFKDKYADLAGFVLAMDSTERQDTQEPTGE